jgi:outer membrane autotransporter protein
MIGWRALFGSAVCLCASLAVVARPGNAYAQAVCTCPAGSKNLGNGQCQAFVCPIGHHLGTVNQLSGCLPNRNDHDFDDYHPKPPELGATFNGACRTAVPQIGQIVGQQQQSSFGMIAGVLQARRDALGSAAPVPAVRGFAPSELDGSPGALGYASTASRNPLQAVPAAPAVTSGPTWATWVDGGGDWERRNPLNAYDVARTQSTYTTHAGVDATWANTFLPSDYVVAGLVASYTSIHVDLTSLPAPAKLQLEGPGVGLYAMYLNGGFSADVTTKFDFLNLKEDFSALIAEGFTPTSTLNSIDITGAGVAGNIQYKYKAAWGFIEPTAGFMFSRAMFGGDAAAMDLKDGSTLRLQAGARFGAAFEANGVGIEPTLGLLAYSNVIADGTTLATLGSLVPEPPTDKGLLRAEIDPELNFNLADGYSAYIRGSLRVGSEMVGGAAKLGLRKEF